MHDSDKYQIYLRSWLNSEWKRLGREKIGKANMSPFLMRRKMRLMTFKGKPKQMFLPIAKYYLRFILVAII